MKKLISFGVIMLFLCICFSVTANIDKSNIFPSFSGTILYVGGTGSGNYSTIQAAVENASDGDTVFVYHGFYQQEYQVKGSIDITKSINLVGEEKRTTIINGTIGSLVCIEGLYVNLSGFTFQNGSYAIEVGRHGDSGDVRQANIYDNIFLDASDCAIITWMGTITISNNTLSNDRYGIYFRNSKGSIVNNRITDCIVGIYLLDSRCRVHRNLIQGMSVGISTTSWALVSENNFIQNGRDAEFANLLFMYPIARPIYWHNYWDTWKSPFPIPGSFSIMINHISGIGPFPTQCFDWHPAQEPYDIPDIS
jgi:parallel beta-helix repeat protein